MHRGIGGRRLEDDWKDGARAYYGLTVSGFPNFFMLYGPNTNLGHNSIIFVMECQMTYILMRFAPRRRRSRLPGSAPRGARRVQRELQAELRGTAWAAAGQSWYKDAAGRITNNWPYSTFWYWWCTRRVDLGKYRLVTRAAAAAEAAKTERVAA
jgi:hypothetical protein